jgi:hypothetical protein
MGTLLPAWICGRWKKEEETGEDKRERGGEKMYP